MSDTKGGAKVPREKKRRDDGVKAAAGKAVGSPKEMPRLLMRYRDDVLAKVHDECKYCNLM